MKEITLLILLTTVLMWSCKKENDTGQITFYTSFVKLSDTLMYDSVSLLVIKYSDLSEKSDSSKYYNPNFYSNSMTLKVDKKLKFYFSTESLSFHDGQEFIIKSFELIDNAKNVIYYIPYVTPSEYKNNVIQTVDNLPIPFVAYKDHPILFGLTVIKK